jgi:hypothetical protein
MSRPTKIFFSLISLLLLCCTREIPELSPEEKFEIYLKDFFNSWSEENPLFTKSDEELEIEMVEKNASSPTYSAHVVFPFNWTEFLYQEESDFAQGYETTIQIKSQIEVTHSFKDGNWSFDSARQYDFNSTMIEHADNYSKIIGDAWIKRLPAEKPFIQKELFKRIPPNRDY